MDTGAIFAAIVVPSMIAWVLVILAKDIYHAVTGLERFRNAVLFSPTTRVQQLLDASPQFARDHEALFQAIFQGRNEVLNLLLERGADVREPLEWGGAALHIAVRYGTFESVIAILAHEADIDDDRGGTPLYWAADQRRMDVVELLLRRGADAKLVAIEEIGMSSFKSRFADVEDYECIRQRIIEAQRKAG